MAGAGYKLFGAGDILTAAQVNTYLNEQAVMVFATTAARDSALTSVLAEGMTCYVKDVGSSVAEFQVYDGSDWVPSWSEWRSYTATLGGFVIGDGTITSRYMVTGTTCHVYNHVDFGSTSTFGSAPTLTLPFSIAQVAATVYLEGIVYINSVTSGLYPIKWRTQGGVNTTAMVQQSSGSYAQLSGVSSSVPDTLTAASGLLRYGSYEIA